MWDDVFIYRLPWDVEDMADDIKQANTEFLKAVS